MMKHKHKEKKLSTLAVAMKCDWEGLDYAIQNYFSGEEFEDPVLTEKWKAAKVLLNDIDEMLQEAMQSASDEDIETAGAGSDDFDDLGD